MGLNKEQQAAVEYLDGPLLVLAGPGTGKTQLLSAKVAYILENTDTNPENILCLTFTESGASNMRERLRTMVGQAAGSVNIFTYHAFGSNVLERYKNYAENFDRRLENVIDGVTQYKYIREILEELPATDILKNSAVNDLVETISNAKSARLSANDLKVIAEQNLKDSEVIAESASRILENLVPRQKFDLAVENVYRPLLEALLEQSSETPIVDSIERTANVLARDLARIIDEESSSEKPKVTPLTKWKDKNFERKADGSYRLKDYIANKKLLSLAEVMRKYDEKLRAEGLFDFADMIEEAIRALKEDRGFRLSLSELFQYILLDEFQDTNPSQFELIKLLTDYENPVVMAVGDDDQAIFEFQGASASNLLDFQNYYHAKVITLLDNYRSTGEILDFSHRVAEQVYDSFAKHHNINKLLRSMMDFFKKTEQSESKELVKVEAEQQISRHEFLTANDEYYWVAERISELLKSGESADNIAIIAPKHKYVAPLLPYLKAHEINVSYEKKSNLLEDAKIHELIVIATFCSELANEKQPSHRLLEILSFPFLEIPAITAIQAIHRAHESKKTALDYLLESSDEKLKALADWLAKLALVSFEAPLELWFDYLTGTAEVPECSFRSPYLKYYEEHSTPVEKFEFYENLNVLKNTVVSHTKNPKPKLEDFIKTIEDYTDAGASIMNTSIYQDGNNAIQIMSAHKSKGLEFKYVFLIAVDDMAWGKAKGNNNLFKLPNNLVQIRHTGITDDEQLRLLFVAITRAKQYLIMTNSIQDFFEKKVNRLSYLDEKRDDKAEKQLSPFLPEKSQEIILHYDDFDIDTHIETARYNWTAAYTILSPNLKKILKSRLENYRLTATDLTSFIDIIYAGPESIYKNRILRAPDEPLTEQLAYGNLIHATFEQVTNQGISDTEALEFFRAKVGEVPLATHDLKSLEEKGAYSLKIALETFAPILRHEHAKAEVNLSSEHPVLDGIPLTGKIDHLEINPEAKTIEVYDFKTGNYHDSKWQSHPTLYKYAMQLGFYKLLLNLSPSYRNYKVTKGHILFVSPDADGLVYDKVYDYEPSEEAELKKLAKVVYRQITSLDFIENPELFLSPDKSKTLKEVKAFVARLLESAPDS